MEDSELLRLYARENSEAAFAELVRRHIDLVYSAALRRVGDDAHLAKDVTQKVFIALARQAAAVADRRTLAGWLYTASRYSAAHVVRTEQRRKAREQKAQIMNDILSENPSDLEWERIRPQLDSVMDQLSDLDREAVLLRFFSGCAFAEVAARLGVSEEAARKRVARALDKLRSLLARRGIASTSTVFAGLISTHAVTSAPAGLAASLPAAAMAAAAAPGFSLLQFLGLSSGGAGVAGIIGLAAVINLPAIGAALYELHASRAARVALVSATRDYSAEAARWESLERSAATAPAAPAEHSDSGVSRFLAENPQARAMLVEAGMSGSLRTNGLFYRLAGFTPDQEDRFQQVLVNAWADSLAMAPAAAAAAPTDEQLREIVGDDAFRQFADYNQMIDAYRWTSAAAREMSLDNAPISAEQAHQLAQILANNSSIYRDGGALNASAVNSGAALASVDWGAALTQARAVLSASQWKSAEPVFLDFQFNGELHRAAAQ